MLVWVVFALMSTAVVVALLHPLVARRERSDGVDDGATAVYKDQLAEVDAELRRGLISIAEAENARREIARRLLAATDRGGASQAAHDGEGRPARSLGTRLAVPLIAAMLPISAILIYAQTGRPGVPDQPLSARLKSTPAIPAEIAQLLGAVEARLKTNPEDGRGWDVIGPVYLRLGRYAEAEDAFRRSIRLLGESPRRLAGLAEVLMLSGDGRLSDETRQVMGRLLALDPDHVQARFWLAFGKEQDGDVATAAREYDEILKASPADAPWRAMLEERLVEVRKAAAQADSAPRPPSAPPVTGPSGPSAADISAAEQMSPADRQKMITAMVDGLEQRLARDGRDLAGWERLVRSLVVLGRMDDAAAALGRARQSLGDDPKASAALGDLAKSLGLGT